MVRFFNICLCTWHIDSLIIYLLLPGLADENESVRDAALSAGHVFVEHYATTYALLFELVTSDFFSASY
jgi:hypothetical protein